LDKNQIQLEDDLTKLKGQIKSAPKHTFNIAQQYRIRAEQILFVDGEIKALLIMAQCCWCLMDYRQGLKLVKDAYSKQTQLETDDHLPEILHLFCSPILGPSKVLFRATILD